MYLNNGCFINASMLEQYLLFIDGVDELCACKLLYADDPQNVPCTVELMSAVIKLSRIDPSKPPYTPNGTLPNIDTIKDFVAIDILGTLLHNILEPFINVNLSLSEQVIHLSCFTHILYLCYHDQHHSLMPNQLYYDLQTCVKNVMFYIGKQQKLELSAPFSLLDVRDDNLELLFTFLWMCGGHNNTINYQQALDRLGAARNIGGVYACNPNLAHGHR
jgi:hypothetical protein